MNWTAVVLVLASAAAAAAPPETAQLPPPADSTKTSEWSDAPTLPPPAPAPAPPLTAPLEPALAPQPSWPKEFPALSGWDVAVVGALGAANIAIVLTPPPAQANWTGGIAFDDWVRGGLKLSSANGRIALASFSDWLLAAMAALPLVDAWLDAGYSRGRPDVAWRLMVIDMEAMLSTTFLTLGIQRLTARQRPYAAACITEPNSVDCATSTADNTSFPSGHASVAFTAAVLECVNHAHLDTERTGWSAIACPLSLSVASVTALMRIAADKHYASDVLVGALAGAGIGYLVPTLHFRLSAKESSTLITPAVSQNYFGLTIAGNF